MIVGGRQRELFEKKFPLDTLKNFQNNLHLRIFGSVQRNLFAKRFLWRTPRPPLNNHLSDQQKKQRYLSAFFLGLCLDKRSCHFAKSCDTFHNLLIRGGGVVQSEGLGWLRGVAIKGSTGNDHQFFCDSGFQKGIRIHTIGERHPNEQTALGSCEFNGCR